jgi:hypothetical protein
MRNTQTNRTGDSVTKQKHNQLSYCLKLVAVPHYRMALVLPWFYLGLFPRLDPNEILLDTENHSLNFKEQPYIFSKCSRFQTICQAFSDYICLFY